MILSVTCPQCGSVFRVDTGDRRLGIVSPVQESGGSRPPAPTAYQVTCPKGHEVRIPNSNRKP